MSILVVDVGTSGVRGAVVRPDGAVEHITRARAPRQPVPRPGGVRRRGHGRGVLTVATATLAEGGPVEAVGIANQRASTVVWTGRPGAGAPGLGWQDLRTVGTCLELQAKGIRVARTHRPPSWPPCSIWPIPTVALRARRAGLRHRRHVGGVDAVGWPAPHHRRVQRRRHRAHLRRRIRLEPRDLEALHIPGAVLPTIVDSSGAMAGGRPRRRPCWPVWPVTAGVPHRQACTRPGQAKATFGTGACSTSAWAPSGPSRRHGGGRDHPGDRLATRGQGHWASRRSCCRRGRAGVAAGRSGIIDTRPTRPR